MKGLRQKHKDTEAIQIRPYACARQDGGYSTEFRVPAHRLKQIYPAPKGHHRVGDDQIDTMHCQHFERYLPIRGGQRGEALILEDLDEQLANVRFVVDDEYHGHGKRYAGRMP